VTASATGLARGAVSPVAAGTTDVRIVIGAGATVRGKVIAADERTPIAGATIECSWFVRRRFHETPALPDEPTARSGADGTFVLSGVPAGPVALRVWAEGFHTKLDATMTSSDGAALGPLLVELNRVGPDDTSHTELVGVGMDLSPDGDALRVTRVVFGSGAFDAGIGFGDRIIAVDGAPVGPLGVEGAMARLRGAAGTQVSVTVVRNGQNLPLLVERRLLRA
jgi:hypothetical protein